jgi:hypothetical protein
MFCPYKNIFGEVNKGIHSYRVLNIAVVDVLLTIVSAYLVSKLFPEYSFRNTAIILFLLGIILHRLFCVRTTIDKLLFK